jgi:hypothetical protein
LGGATALGTPLSRTVTRAAGPTANKIWPWCLWGLMTVRCCGVRSRYLMTHESCSHTKLAPSQRTPLEASFVLRPSGQRRWLPHAQETYVTENEDIATLQLRAGVTFPRVLAFPPGAPLRQGGVSVSDGSCGGLRRARDVGPRSFTLLRCALSSPHIAAAPL